LLVLPKDEAAIKIIDKFGSYMGSYDELPAALFQAYSNFRCRRFVLVDSGSITDGSSHFGRAFIEVWLQFNESDAHNLLE
jgi:hypothetical protein